MATIKRLHFKRSNQILRLLWVMILLSACNYPATRGPVWLGDPVVSREIDKTGNPIDEATNFSEDTVIVYCPMSIQGPTDFKMPVRWYFEDELIYEELVDFGSVRHASPALTYQNSQPLPPGNYRCEFSLDPNKPNRFVNFHIGEMADVPTCIDASQPQCSSPLVSPTQ